MQQAILRERQTSMMLDSPFIVRLYTTYRDKQFLYFLYQAAIGGELFDLCQDHDGLFGNTECARFFTAGAALALDYMHSKKIIYRDLKLENLLLDDVGYPLVADMGLAKIVVGKTYTVCGTADYMAPEVLRQGGHNRAVDWWALGILIFILMSGRSPFDASDTAQIYRNVVKGLKKDHYPDTFSRSLVDVISGLCRKKPEERLPMGPKGFTHLQESQWFKHFDWQSMVERTLTPPWTPPIRTSEELTNRVVCLPPMVQHEDTESTWDAEF